jgi:class 3 adenylate cyclase
VKRFAEQYEFTFDAPPERLWRAISDTDAINRDAGLPSVHYTYEPEPGGLSRAVARARLGPLRLVWDEPPFRWEAPHRVAVERRFRGGPFARFGSDVRVQPAGTGSVVLHTVELDARGALGALLAPLVLARGRRGAGKAYALAGERARADRETVPSRVDLPDVPPASPARVAPFIGALEVLRPHTEHEPEIAARLASLVVHGDDATVARMRPYVLADAWQLPRERVLAAMLAATRGGLLDLSWTIVCPSCRGPKNAVARLAALGEGVHCDGCGVGYDADFDRNVEVTFDARPSGRTAVPPVYCLAGPQTARQTLAQTALPSGGAASLEVVLRAGAYIVQTMPDRTVRFVVEDDAGAGSLDVRVGDGRIGLATSVVRSGMVRVHVANGGSRDAVVRVSEAELSDQIATAAHVTSLQPFRDLFSSEVLGEGIEVAVRSLTVVFTDIIGSTRMYAAAGDARAFRLVRDHFDALHEVVTLFRGAIVKTIGDAVMAVFVDPGDAVAASLRFGAAVAPLRLRIGMHRGPCIALRANDRIDYFGGSVNIASRVAHDAGAGEIVMSAVVADDPRVADFLPPGDRGTLALRGIPEPVEVVRIRAAQARPVGDPGIAGDSLAHRPGGT